MDPVTSIRILETCLYVNDLEKARQFYSEVMKFKEIHYLPNRHLFYRVGKSVLLFFNPEATKKETQLPSHWGGGRQHIAFGVPPEEYEHFKARIQQANLPILHEEEWKRGKSFYFLDPNGLLVEIAQPQIWGFEK